MTMADATETTPSLQDDASNSTSQFRRTYETTSMTCLSPCWKEMPIVGRLSLLLNIVLIIALIYTVISIQTNSSSASEIMPSGIQMSENPKTCTCPERMVEKDSCLQTVRFPCQNKTEKDKCDLEFKLLELDGEDFALTFDEGVEECRKLNLVLWDVKSEEEWNYIEESLFVGYDYWLNLRPEPVNFTREIELKKEEAGRGKGLPVIRKTDNFQTNFSRLFQVDTRGDSCIYTDYFYWKIGSCQLKKQVICVKRN